MRINEAVGDDAADETDDDEDSIFPSKSLNPVIAARGVVIPVATTSREGYAKKANALGWKGWW